MDAMDPWTLALPGISKPPTKVLPHDVVVGALGAGKRSFSTTASSETVAAGCLQAPFLAHVAARHCDSIAALMGCRALGHNFVCSAEVSVCAWLVLLGDLLFDYVTTRCSPICCPPTSKALRQHFLGGGTRAPRATQWSPLPASAPKCSRNNRPRA
jgi:hypothetical protein